MIRQNNQAQRRMPSLRLVRHAAALLAGACLAAGAAHAENHALIMWIGDYGDPKVNLPGIDLDARNARVIARAMGVPEQNIREVSNDLLSRSRVNSELSGLAGRIQQGDKVFIYFSGHGFQAPGIDGARCTEGLVTRGTDRPDLFLDVELKATLERIGAKASQVVMMNDSCFSGGAATKGMRSVGGDAVAKFYPGEVKGNTAVTEDYRCGEATNKIARNLEVMAAKTNVLYVAASTDAQVSYATPRGSAATMAWAHCLTTPSADSNRSGSITGAELQSCAQNYINTNFRFTQTVMLQGETSLPLSFASAQAGVPVNAPQALADIQRMADKNIQVQLVPASRSLRIKQDFIDFQVNTSQAGYLYVFQVGSDGKTFNMLFPNKLDTNNRVPAGTVSLPRPAWKVRAGGPAGTSHLLAVLTLEPKDMSKGFDNRGSFSTGAAEGDLFKNLVVEASGANGGIGSFGASAVVSIQETP